MSEKGFISGVEKILYCRINNFYDICYIIIITRHELCLVRPVSAFLIVCSKVSKVVFIHSVYNSELFLASCCFPFLLHVVANSICIFLVTRQLVLFSARPKFLHFFVVKKGVPGCSCEKFHFEIRQFFILFFSRGLNFASI